MCYCGTNRFFVDVLLLPMVKSNSKRRNIDFSQFCHILIIYQSCVNPLVKINNAFYLFCMFKMFLE